MAEEPQLLVALVRLTNHSRLPSNHLPNYSLSDIASLHAHTLPSSPSVITWNVSSEAVQDCEQAANSCGSWKSSKVEMNVAVMTSGALCLCAQVPAAQASARASVAGN